MTFLTVVICLLAFSSLILFLAFRWKPSHWFLRVFRALTLAFSSLFLIWVGLLVGIFMWMEDPWHFRIPSDEKLISLFYRNRDAFEELNRMAQEDARHGYFFSSKAYTREKTFNESRARQYQALLQRIGHGVDMEVAEESPSDVTFIFSESESLVIGPESTKGIEYNPWNLLKDTKPVKSLDNSYDLPEGEYCRSITDKWFIFYTYID